MRKYELWMIVYVAIMGIMCFTLSYAIQKDWIGHEGFTCVEVLPTAIMYNAIGWVCNLFAVGLCFMANRKGVTVNINNMGRLEVHETN